MATRTNKVEVEIVAIDEASPKIDKLEKKIDGLESDEARIIVTANIERLDSKLTEALAKMKTLDGDELTVQARLVGSLEQDLIDANKLFKQLDGKTGTVRFKADTRELDQAKSKFDSMAESAQSLPGPLGEAASLLNGPAGMAVGAAGVAAGLFSAMNSSANLAINAQNIASLTGSSTENASRFLAVAQQANIEYNDVADLVSQVNGALSQSPDLAKQLGVNLADGKDGIERILELIEKLNSGLFPPDVRNNIMQQVFGEEGVRQVENLITLVGTDLQAAMDGVSETQVISEEDVERARRFKQIVTEMETAWQNVSITVGDRLIPLLQFAAFIVDTINTGLENIPGGVGDRIKAVLTGGLGDFFEWYMNQWRNAFSDDQVEGAAKFQADRLNDILSGIKPDGTRAVADATATAADEQARWNVEMGEYLRFLRERHNAALPEIQAYEKRKAAIDNYRDSLARLNIEETERQRRAADQPSLGQELNAERQRQAAIGDTEEALQSLADTQDELQANAIENALATSRKPLETLTRVQNINQAIRDLAEFIRDDLKGAIPNLDDPLNEMADDVLSRLNSLATDMDRELVAAFEGAGGGNLGIATAQALADQFVKSLSQQTGLSADEIKRRFGWDNLEVTLKVKLDDSALAQQQLDILKGLTGDTPFTAALQLALDAKSLTPTQVMTLVQNQFRFFKIPIPSEIEAPDGDAAIAAAERALYGKSVSIPVTPDFSKFPTQFANGVALAIPPGNINIINPPGTPAATVGSAITYGRRNGDRPDT